MLEDAAKRFGAAFLISGIVFTAFFCTNGILDYIKLKREISARELSVRKTEAENIALRSQVERLQKDDKYLEDVARTKFGFIKEGERVYRIEK